MMTINPYVNFPGTTEQAFAFYKSIFGGEFTMVQRFKDIPDGSPMSAEEREKIMHISLPIANVVLMGTDAIASMGHPLTMGNNYSISVNLTDLEEAQRIFTALSVGAQIQMPLAPMFWGAHYGMLTDQFGLQWMINCTAEAPSHNAN